ncbi:OmpA family protein [Aliiroseovarius sp.]|uniref:OmpA family protein n=1 Tax=Aliiroseovarius sp. TaxID=1872442 RepID=UPI00261CAE57|nr:OmpA family protein [Aliiroseovarius sp.]
MLRPAVISLLLAGPALALELPAGAVMTGEDNDRRGSLAIATGPFVDGSVPTHSVDGAVIRQAWRLPGTGLTTAQLMQQFRSQLSEDGWRVTFDCQEVTCGGFDFRFATLVFGEPVMHVDLGDYRYLAASKEGSHIALLVSRSPGAGYVQVLRVGPGQELPPLTTGSDMTGTPPVVGFPASEEAVTPVGLGIQMEQAGFAVLSDLTFQTGSSALGDADFASLAELAGYLAANPDKRVTLVGHTDAVGSLENNIALSRERAASVRQTLIDRYGAGAGQVAADGVGFLSPVASNQTEEGREANRRVEVILTTTE